MFNRIVVRFPRPVIIAAGWLVFLASIAVTVGVFYAVMYVLFALWPDQW